MVNTDASGVGPGAAPHLLLDEGEDHRPVQYISHKLFTSSSLTFELDYFILPASAKAKKYVQDVEAIMHLESVGKMLKRLNVVIVKEITVQLLGDVQYNAREV